MQLSGPQFVIEWLTFTCEAQLLDRISSFHPLGSHSEPTRSLIAWSQGIKANLIYTRMSVIQIRCNSEIPSSKVHLLVLSCPICDAPDS